ncbi:hypothetical protein EE612_033571 [Oryza sativa]|nr:hypothetical protein EE612_033571 [Oryza sativa]
MAMPSNYIRIGTYLFDFFVCGPYVPQVNFIAILSMSNGFFLKINYTCKHLTMQALCVEISGVLHTKVEECHGVLTVPARA